MKQFYRYYCIMRPPMPGTIPRGVVKIKDFNDRQMIAEINHEAWGYVEYERPLTAHDVKDYELAPAPAVDNDNCE